MYLPCTDAISSIATAVALALQADRLLPEIVKNALKGVQRRSVATQFTPAKGICACPSRMNLSTVSNKTWPSVEETLNSWNRANCIIASAGAVAHGSIQLNRKSIGIKKRLACTMVSYANFARNMEDSQSAPEVKAEAVCFTIQGLRPVSHQRRPGRGPCESPYPQRRTSACYWRRSWRAANASERRSGADGERRELARLMRAACAGESQSTIAKSFSVDRPAISRLARA